jgi:hypothetical protein
MNLPLKLGRIRDKFVFGSGEGVICLFEIRKGLGIADIVKNIAA